MAYRRVRRAYRRLVRGRGRRNGGRGWRRNRRQRVGRLHRIALCEVDSLFELGQEENEGDDLPEVLEVKDVLEKFVGVGVRIKLSNQVVDGLLRRAYDQLQPKLKSRISSI